MILQLLVAVLSALTVTFWWREFTPFLNRMKVITSEGGITAPLRTIVALPLLFPFFIDFGVTVGLLTLFGFTGGITGLVSSLVMSNTVSFLISNEVRKSQRVRVMGSQPEPAAGDSSLPFVRATPQCNQCSHMIYLLDSIIIK